MPSIDPVILELRAETEQATSAVKRYATDVEGSMGRAGAAADKASRQLTAGSNDNVRSLNAVRIAGIGAGQQLQDMTVQIQSGTAATTVFAQQVPQLAFALSGLAGNTNKTADTIGKFATFLSGPWGTAITIAVIAGAALIKTLDGQGASALDAAPKIDTLTDAIKRLVAAQDDIGATGTVEAQVAKLQSDKLKLQNDQNLVDADVAAQYEKRIQSINKEIEGYQQIVKWNAVTVQGEKDKDAYKKAQRKAEQDAESAAKRAAAEAKRAAEEVAKENERVRDRIVTLRDQIQAQEMINNGNEKGAAILLAKWEIERQFPKANKELIAQAQELAVQLINQKAALEDIRDLRNDIMKMAKNGAIIDFDDKKLTAAIGNIQRVSNAVVGAAFKSSKAIDAIREKAIDNLTDGITNAITGAESLGDAFSKVADQIIADLIRIAVQKAIIEPLFGERDALTGNSSGGILGGLSFLGSLFGHAGGGGVSPGSISRVNEQNGGIELLKMGSQGGTIVPLGQANQTMNAPGSNSDSTIRVEIMMDNDVFTARVQEASIPVAVAVVQRATPTIANAGANLATRSAGRPRL